MTANHAELLLASESHSELLKSVSPSAIPARTISTQSGLTAMHGGTKPPTVPLSNATHHQALLEPPIEDMFASLLPHEIAPNELMSSENVCGELNALRLKLLQMARLHQALGVQG